MATLSLGDAVAAVRAGADSVFAYIAREVETVPGGVRWRTLNDAGEPQHRADLYSNGGIPLFLADYYRVTGNARALELAVQGLEWCSAPEAEFLADRFAGTDPWCLLGGRTGPGLAWLRLAAVSGDRLALSRAAAVGDTLAARDPGPTPGLAVGEAGQGVFLVRLWERTRDERHLAAALRRAQWLEEQAVHVEGGVAWAPTVGSTQRPLTSVCHGAAGVGCFLLTLYEATHEERYAVRARQAAAALAQAARPDRGGLNWLPSFGATTDADLSWRSIPIGPEIARCQWCNGAPGIGLFFARAYEVFRDELYRQVAEAAGEATCAYGDGRANPTYCHGLAGNAELLIELHRVTGSATWQVRAHDFARRMLAYAVPTPEGEAWPSDDPAQLAPDLLCGAAGVGHVFLRVLDSRDVPMALF